MANGKWQIQRCLFRNAVTGLSETVCFLLPERATFSARRRENAKAVMPSETGILFSFFAIRAPRPAQSRFLTLRL